MAQRPNFLIMMADQHSPHLMGCAGDPVVRTPNFDRLAKRGVIFDNCYCSGPVCGPSRMGFMTGRYCSENNSWTNRCFLPSDVPTFAHALGAGGYEVVLGGRMHFMGPDQRHGFQRRIIGDVGGGVGFEHIPPANGQSRQSVTVAGPGRTMFTAYDAAVLEACSEYMDEKGHQDAEAPFCLVAGFVCPHNPYISPKPLFDYYYDRVELPELPAGYLENMPPVMQEWRERRGIHDLSEEEVRIARAGYYGLVEYFDGIIGGMLEALEDAGLAENTIVIYCSDHGEMAGENGLWFKSNFYEGSVRVPLIISAPGRFMEGVRRPELASLVDIAPTLIELAEAPEIPVLSGRSLVPLLTQQAVSDWRDEVFSEHIKLSGDVPSKMMRSGPWKFIHYEGHPPILFNLDEDPHEFVNRADDPELHNLVRQLHYRALQGWDPERALGILKRRKRDYDIMAGWQQAKYSPDRELWPTPAGSNVWPEE